MQVYLSPIAAAVQRCAQVVDQKAGEETGRKKEKKKGVREEVEKWEDRRGALAHLSNKHFLCFSPVKAVFHSTCDIHLNHRTGKHNFIFWVRQMVPLLRRLITVMHNINKGKHLKGKCNLPRVQG